MDPKSPARAFIALGASNGVSARLPGRSEPLPPIDTHVVRPETREEMVRGRRMIAMPALAPHGDQHFRLDYVIGAYVQPGYVGSTDLLTRQAAGSNFATDTCVRKAGDDPATKSRYLEELAFEVVSEQSLKDITERAEDVTARGVRRFFAIFVKDGEVCEWSARERTWKPLGPNATIHDPCLLGPLPASALLDAAAADDAVAQALAEKHNPVIEAIKAESNSRGLRQGKAAAILAVLAARGLAVDAETHARILACGDASQLDGWIARAAVAASAAEIFAGS
jgi:hypothetical protein